MYEGRGSVWRWLCGVRGRGDSTGLQEIEYFSNLPEVLGIHRCRFMGLSLVGGEERKVGWTTEGRTAQVTTAPGVGRAWMLLLLELNR